MHLWTEQHLKGTSLTFAKEDSLRAQEAMEVLRDKFFLKHWKRRVTSSFHLWAKAERPELITKRPVGCDENAWLRHFVRWDPHYVWIDRKGRRFRGTYRWMSHISRRSYSIWCRRLWLEMEEDRTAAAEAIDRADQTQVEVKRYLESRPEFPKVKSTAVRKPSEAMLFM